MTEIKEITVGQVHEKHENGEKFSLIDVRRDNEWQSKHIEYATHLQLDFIDGDTAAKIVPDKDTCIVLYCAAGVRSLTAAKKFMDLGYTNVFSMKGGLSRWKY